MKRRTFLIGLAAVPLVAFAESDDRRCPICDGRLVRAGIMKDDVSSPSRNLQLWNRSYHGDFWPSYSEDSPICSQCLTAFREYDETWARSTEVLKSFWVPLSPAIAAFPFPSKASVTSRVVFSQEFKGIHADGGLSESVSFWCRCSPKRLKTMETYAAISGLSFSADSSRGEPGASYVTASAANQSFKPTLSARLNSKR